MNCLEFQFIFQNSGQLFIQILTDIAHPITYFILQLHFIPLMVLKGSIERKWMANKFGNWYWGSYTHFVFWNRGWKKKLRIRWKSNPSIYNIKIHIFYLFLWDTEWYFNFFFSFNHHSNEQIKLNNINWEILNEIAIHGTFTYKSPFHFIVR